MTAWSNSTVLQLIDAVAIAIAQGYMLARTRLTMHPSPVVRLAAAGDAMAWDTAMLERELAVFRRERERIPAKQRPHYTPTHRLEILQIMRLRDWSAAETARRFVLHPNSIRNWLKQFRTAGKSSHLFTGPVWNRLHDAVRWTVHEWRQLCPEPEVGTRTIARHIVRAAVKISRSSVQRILVKNGPSHVSEGRPRCRLRAPNPIICLPPGPRTESTLRIWLRVALLPISARALQRWLDHYKTWYNGHRPHASLGGRTPNEAWNGIELPEPIPIRATDPDDIVIQIHRESYRGDRRLPIMSIRVNRKEAA